MGSGVAWRPRRQLQPVLSLAEGGAATIAPAVVAWGGVEFPAGLFREAQREQGARGLVLAVLSDAVRDVVRPQTPAARRREAVAWIEAMDAVPFGFVWCVDVLGWDPQAFRRALFAAVRADFASTSARTPPPPSGSWRSDREGHSPLAAPSESIGGRWMARRLVGGRALRP